MKGMARGLSFEGASLKCPVESENEGVNEGYEKKETSWMFGGGSNRMTKDMRQAVLLAVQIRGVGGISILVLI
jgi:hypothetical protein